MHLSTVIDLHPVNGMSNEAFSNYNGGESSDGSGSARVSDIVDGNQTDGGGEGGIILNLNSVCCCLMSDDFNITNIPKWKVFPIHKLEFPNFLFMFRRPRK